MCERKSKKTIKFRFASTAYSQISLSAVSLMLVCQEFMMKRLEYPFTLSIRSFACLVVFPPKETPKKKFSSETSFLELWRTRTITEQKREINKMKVRISQVNFIGSSFRVYRLEIKIFVSQKD